MKWLRKYWLWVAIVAFFVVWNGFVSQSSLMHTLAVRGRIARLESQREHYREQIERDSTFIRQLDEPEFLERFARENLYMMRTGEQIYVIEK